MREVGDVNAGVRELRAALRLARRTGSQRCSYVLASLGVALVYAGRTAASGLTAFDQAVQLSSGMLTARVLHRRGIVLWTLGRHAAALADLDRAVSVLGEGG